MTQTNKKLIHITQDIAHYYSIFPKPNLNRNTKFQRNFRKLNLEKFFLWTYHFFVFVNIFKILIKIVLSIIGFVQSKIKIRYKLRHEYFLNTNNWYNSYTQKYLNKNKRLTTRSSTVSNEQLNLQTVECCLYIQARSFIT